MIFHFFDNLRTGASLMKAVRIHEFGGPEVLSYEDVRRPAPRRREVLLQVHAAGVNPADWQTRSGGGAARYIKKSLPAIMGWDVSGVVLSVGRGVKEYHPGDAVFGFVRFPKQAGTYAEYVACPVNEIAIKPRSLSHIEAAALPLVSLTAWQAIIETAMLKKDQSILIHAAAGGVGHVAVQLAKWKGAYVIGTASKRNDAFLRGIGADEIVNYETTRFERVVGNLDVVLDSRGGEIRQRSWATLRPGGILISLKGIPREESAAHPDVRGHYVLAKPDGMQLARIAQLVDEIDIKPHIDAVFPLSRACNAHELSEQGHTRGKIVLQVIE
jgi:NADPH:quinone reductase-like Zn-dependent oxidoreductase